MALQGSISTNNGTPFFYSTINVFQAKEKFGECRVYCSLAGQTFIEKNIIKNYVH